MQDIEKYRQEPLGYIKIQDWSFRRWIIAVNRIVLCVCHHCR